MAHAGAMQLIEKCLGFNSSGSEVILVCFDRFGQDVADLVIDAANESVPGRCQAIYVPLITQEFIANHTVPTYLAGAISLSHALVFCVTNSDKYTRCRIRVLEAAIASKHRILHMPGVNIALFELGMEHADVDSIQAHAQELQELLDGASEVTVVTRDASESQHRLTLSIRDRKSHVCGGKALPGEIMNVPTGEVYVAPLETLSNGSLVLNGSTDHLVFGKADDIVLHFHDGRLDLSASRFSNTPSASSLSKDLIEESKRNPDSMYLCELGIGVNAGIRHLTGDEILDEKAAGTLHIALGSNTPFGGTLSGTYHRDMIFVPEALIVDDITVALPASPHFTRVP